MLTALVLTTMVEMYFATGDGISYSVPTTEEFCRMVLVEQRKKEYSGREFYVIIPENGKMLKNVIMVFCLPPIE